MSYFGHITWIKSNAEPSSSYWRRPPKRKTAENIVGLDRVSEDCEALYLSILKADRHAQNRTVEKSRIRNREVGAAGAC